MSLQVALLGRRQVVDFDPASTGESAARTTANAPFPSRGCPYVEGLAPRSVTSRIRRMDPCETTSVMPGRSLASS